MTDKLDKRSEWENTVQQNSAKQPQVTYDVICPTCGAPANFVDGDGYNFHKGAK